MSAHINIIFKTHLTPGKIIKFSPEEGPSGGQVVVAGQYGDGTDGEEEGGHRMFSSVAVVVVVDVILHSGRGRGYSECT